MYFDFFFCFSKHKSSKDDEELFINQVVNVGSSIEISVLDLANLIIKQANSKSKITFLDPLKEGDMTRRMPDISKFKKSYGSNLITLESGISELIVNLETSLNE